MARRHGNQSVDELRRAYRTLTPAQRLARGIELSRFASKLRGAGRRAGV